MSQQVTGGDYIITYKYKGETQSVYFYAKSYEDAEQRLESLRASGAITGRVEAVLHTSAELGDKIFPLTSRRKTDGKSK